MGLLLMLMLLFGIGLGYKVQPAGNANYVCREGEEYSACRSPCEKTCYSREIRINCTRPCIAGCFCRSGLVRARDNTCVHPDECYRPSCQENEEYSECGSPCELNCTNFDESVFCTKPCYGGCFCKPNFVRDSKRRCVPTSSCIPVGNQHCGPNEQYVSCVSFCNSCWELNYCQTPFCRPGCDCKPGFYRDYYGECISETQCYDTMYGLQNSCRENEVYTDCVNPCNDCVPGGKCSYSQYSCEPGCDCKRGYLRNEMGFCVPQKYCYKQTQENCPPNEQYYVCIPKCRNTCDTYNDSYATCDTNCTTGCFCRGGWVRRRDGICVAPRDCPVSQIPSCPPGNVFYNCLPTCRNTCENRNSTRPCPRLCIAGCFCPRGFIKRRDGLCVRPENCELNCGFNEEYRDCGTACPATCSTLKENQPCSQRCIKGCFCQRGYVWGPDGICIQPRNCPERSTPFYPRSEGLEGRRRESNETDEHTDSQETTTAPFIKTEDPTTFVSSENSTSATDLAETTKEILSTSHEVSPETTQMTTKDKIPSSQATTINEEMSTSQNSGKTEETAVTSIEIVNKEDALSTSPTAMKPKGLSQAASSTTSNATTKEFLSPSTNKTTTKSEEISPFINQTALETEEFLLTTVVTEVSNSANLTSDNLTTAPKT